MPSALETEVITCILINVVVVSHVAFVYSHSEQPSDDVVQISGIVLQF